MKSVQFLGDSLKQIRAFPADVKNDSGYQIDKVQRGKQPDDFKLMPTIGKGVEEIRIRDEAGIYRIIYTARTQIQFIPCMPSRKRRKQHPNMISILPKSDIKN